MTTEDIRDGVAALSEQCDESYEQRCIKGVLLSLTAAIYSNRQDALLNHVCAFSQRGLVNIQALREALEVTH